MLVEVMRADATFHAGEREAVRAAGDKFALSGGGAQALAGARQHTARGRPTCSPSPAHQIASRMPQKLRMIEHMWRVAYADGHLSAHRRHVMAHRGPLLHVPQGAYVNARMWAPGARRGPKGHVARPRGAWRR